MATVPYHQAKETIEKRIADYSSGSEGLILPNFTIQPRDKETHIEFRVSSDTNYYNLIRIFATRMGDLVAKNDWTSFDLFSGNLLTGKTRIHFYHNTNLINFVKDGDLTSKEIEAVIEAYKIGNSIKEKSSPRQRLGELGITIYEPNRVFNFDYIGGYERIKQEIRDTVIFPSKNPEVYEKIARATRRVYESIMPKAVLFEGPPGTGKTTFGRIIAGEVDIPMVYVPVESIMIKWHGESERNMAAVFDACKDLGNSIMFMDEIDSLGIKRSDSDTERTARRVLSVMLTKIDGFETDGQRLLIGATNTKEQLDKALLDRFDVSIYFHLPEPEERLEIFRNYAQQLNSGQLEVLAQQSQGVSGRNIKDICEHSERAWASKLSRGITQEDLPPLDEYLNSLKLRQISGI